MSLTKRLQNRGEDRGAALVEFAVVLLVLLPLLSVVFDAGLGYAAARSSSSIVRSAAQVGVRAGENRNADFLILQALKAEYGNGADVTSIIVYESDPAGTGDFDPACVGNGKCNQYTGATLAALLSSQFDGEVDDGAGGTTCDPNDLDANWCPLDRRPTTGDVLFLGVVVDSSKRAAIGLGTDEFFFSEKAVFPLYFPPEIPPLAP